MTMNAEKRKRLEAAGWKSATVQEFLNLDDADMEYIETKLALTKAVREQRRRKRLTQLALAERMKTSQSRVAKIESGDPTVSIDLILRALFTLGLSRKELAKAI
jgi:ribosome-binding protein aMBF1 (putative translation factor)